MMRWGGLFSAYYRWREGVGPRTGCKPLMCVNFEAEGDPSMT